MSKKLVDFLIDVASDPKKKAKLGKNADSVLKDYDLSGPQKVSIKAALHHANARVDKIKKHLTAGDKKKIKDQHGSVTINCII